jgi:polyferredoxin
MMDAIFTTGAITYAALIAAAIVAYFFRKMWLRYVVLLTSLVLIGFLQMGCPSPIGAIQNLLAGSGELAGKVPFIVKLALVVVPTFFMGKIFCGWVCHKGAVQEFLYQKKLRVKVPKKLDKALRLVKYVVLAALVVSPLVFHYKIFNPDTQAFKAFFNLGGPLSAVVLMGAIAVSSLFIYGPFCRYLCPVGALLGLVSLVSLKKPRLCGEGCIGCGLSQKACQMGSFVCPPKDQFQPRRVRVDTTECIMCGECRNVCPKKVIR